MERAETEPSVSPTKQVGILPGGFFYERTINDGKATAGYDRQ